MNVKKRFSCLKTSHEHSSTIANYNYKRCTNKFTDSNVFIFLIFLMFCMNLIKVGCFYLLMLFAFWQIFLKVLPIYIGNHSANNNATISDRKKLKFS